MTFEALSSSIQPEDLTKVRASSAAHDLVRKDLNGQRSTVLLGELLGVLLEPYADESQHAKRLRFTAPHLRVGESSAAALALVVHELATNFIKYGALSATTDASERSCVDDNGEVVAMWKETAGPPTAAPAPRTGFGSRLIARSVSGRLDGSIDAPRPSEGAVINCT